MDSDTSRKLKLLARRIGRVEVKPPSIGYQTDVYTPTYLGGTTPGATTYTTQDGYWVRIGALVFFNGRVTWTAASGTGAAQISLPFTAAIAPSGTFRWSGSLWTNNVTIGAFSPQMLITQNTAYFNMWTPANDAGSAVINVEAAGDIVFSGWFNAA